jgi:hypothetical protein
VTQHALQQAVAPLLEELEPGARRGGARQVVDARVAQELALERDEAGVGEAPLHEPLRHAQQVEVVARRRPLDPFGGGPLDEQRHVERATVERDELRRGREVARRAFEDVALAFGRAGEVLRHDEGVVAQPADPGQEEAAPAARMAARLEIDEGRAVRRKLFRAALPEQHGELLQGAPRELVEGPGPVTEGEVEARLVGAEPRAFGRGGRECATGQVRIGFEARLRHRVRS